jgi:starch-binding outer membrane protein, SusD/RagB family
MKRFSHRFLVLTLGVALCTTACKDFLEVPPPGTVNQEFVQTDAANVERVLFSTYDRLQGGNMYGGRIQRVSALLADEIDFQFLGTTNGNGAFTNRLFSVLTNDQGGGIWNDCYAAIYRANVVIEASEGKKYPATDAITNRNLGEALFIRALCHFEVCRFFSKPYSDPARGTNPGAVLRLAIESPVDIKNSPKQRASVEETYAQVLTDVERAIALLPDVTTGAIRANRQAAIAFKARILFDMERYADAAAEADKLINTGSFPLSTPYAAFRNITTFRDGGVLFALSNLSGDDGAGEIRGNYYSYLPTLGIPNYAAVQLPLDSNVLGGVYEISLVRALRTGGRLRSDSLLLGTNTTKKITAKWRGQTKAGNVQTNVPVFRIAEMYLTRAESRAQTGNEGGAREDLNAIRTYSGTFTLDESVSGQALLDSIRLERRRELFLENDRYHELRRLKLNTGPNPAKAFTYNTDIILPIPLAEINGNPGIQLNGNN